MWPAPFLLFGTFHPLLPNVTCCSVWAPRAPEGQPCCVTGVMSLCSRKTCRPLVTRARRPHPSGASPGPSFHACGQCVSLPSGSLSAQLPARALCPGKALGEGGGSHVCRVQLQPFLISAHSDRSRFRSLGMDPGTQEAAVATFRVLQPPG